MKKDNSKANTITPAWLRTAASKRIAITVAFFILAILLAYWRYPSYLKTPSFYAEDGTVFATNIVHMGFVRALLTPFNGYFIWGIYLLEGVSFILNHLFHHGNFLDLPQELAWTSYAFWALLATLPLVLFWNDVKHKFWLVVLGFGLVMMPMPSFNYSVLGTIGNDKFVFLFIAFLLVIKRWKLPKKSHWVYLLDASIVVCAFTNATVYLLFPFMLVPYWPNRKQYKHLAFYKDLLRNRSFISLVIMGVLSAVQLVYVALKGGVANLQNYMLQPFQYGKTIEIFIHRTLLYPFDFWGAKHLNDFIVLCLLVILAAILWRFTRKGDRLVVVFGFWTALIATALFVTQRPGVSQFYSHYQSSGTDNFFYTQNMVILFTVAFVLARSIEHTKRLSRATLLIGAWLIFIPLSMFIKNDIGNNAAMNRGTGSLLYATQQACMARHGSTIQVPIYPEGAQSIELSSHTYCDTAVFAYIPSRQPLPLAPSGNHYILVTKDTLNQTFVANYPNLDGVSVFLSTFGGTKGEYTLNLYNQACTVRLRSTTFNAESLQDNSYFDTRFPAIRDSKHHTYCFNVKLKHPVPNEPSLAMQLSSSSLYPQGHATANGIPLSEDAVFDLLYR